MKRNREISSFDVGFWKSFDQLGIYSKEDGPLLADQNGSSVAGGKNPSDTDEKSDKTNEQSNDSSLGESSSLDTGGLDTDSSFDGIGDSIEDTTSTDGNNEADANSGSSNSEPVNPDENPFKNKNGKSLLDAKLAELQAAVNDTLQRIYANPKLDTVVVSELENLQDSVRNIRETIFMIPLENTVYKYKLAVTSYAALSKDIVNSIMNSDK